MAIPSDINVLIVDDNKVDRHVVQRYLRGIHTVHEADSARSGLSEAQRLRPDCVLIDYHLPDGDGLDIIRQLVGMDVGLVLLTGEGSAKVAVEALKCGADDYIAKSEISGPLLSKSIVNAVERARLRRRVSAQNAALQDSLTVLRERSIELAAANQALMESESRHRAVVEQLPGMVWTVDGDLAVQSLDGSAVPEDIRLSYSKGMDFDHVFRGATGLESLRTAHLLAQLGRPRRQVLTVHGRQFEGVVQSLDADGTGPLTIGVAVDVTDRVDLERQFLHAQRMDSLGRLASGVAHDFNNLLSAILGFTMLAGGQLKSDACSSCGQAHAQALLDLAEVTSAAESGVNLVRQLLSFSRRSSASPSSLDVAKSLRKIERMLQRLVGGNIEIRLHVPDAELPVELDRGSFEQVLVNLVVNASQAMQSNGGLLDIAAGYTPVQGGEICDHEGTVHITVRDTGVGIPPDVQARIFEPFFSTREEHGGTGLGLSTCYSIVSQAGGTMTIDSVLGQGSTFRIELPRSLSIGGNEELDGGGSRLTSRGNGEIVVVLEQDSHVRSLVVRALLAGGYQAIDLETGDEALQVCRELPVGLVVLSEEVAGWRFSEFVERLALVRPDLSILAMTGVGEELEVPHPTENLSVLRLPFRVPDLLHAVRGSLDGRNGPKIESPDRVGRVAGPHAEVSVR